MDIQKILHDSPFKKHPDLKKNLGAPFLKLLLNQLYKDIKTLVSHPDSEKDADMEILRGVKVTEGDIEYKETKSKKSYLFLFHPQSPGLLLETEDSVITMVKATKVVPVTQNNFGDLTRSELFVVKSSILEHYTVLDKEFCRSQGGQTLSIEQLSEALLVVCLSSSMQ